MNILINTLFDTEYGIILIGALILIAILIEFFSNNKTPKF